MSRPWSDGLQASGINPRQFSVLALIAADPGLSQAELARRALVTPQSMSEMLTRLEAAGLAHRSDTTAGRSAQVAITEDGRATLAAAYPQVLRLQQESLAALDPVEQRELGRMLAKVIAQHEA
ncbi:MAG TPA: MarR family transcriptional regulator [Microlunatus sp.]